MVRLAIVAFVCALLSGAHAFGVGVRTRVVTDRSAEELAHIGGEWRDAALYLSAHTWNVTTPMCVAPAGPMGECGPGLIRFTPAPYQHSSCLDDPFRAWEFTIDEASSDAGMWDAATQREYAVVVSDPESAHGRDAPSSAMDHPRDCPVATLILSPGGGVDTWSTAAGHAATERGTLSSHLFSTVACGVEGGQWSVVRISLSVHAPRPALLYVTGTYDTLHDPMLVEYDQDHESSLSTVAKLVSLRQGRAAQFIVRRNGAAPDAPRFVARLINTHRADGQFVTLNTPFVYGNNHGDDVCLCGVNVECYDADDHASMRATLDDIHRPPPYPTSDERGTVEAYSDVEGNATQSAVLSSTRFKQILAVIIVVVACLAFAALIILFLRAPAAFYEDNSAPGDDVDAHEGSQDALPVT